MSYRLIDSGKNQRREYLSKNRSPLFKSLPERDFAQEQKKSYADFLHRGLKDLLKFYFSANGRKLEDYNNQVWINVEELQCHEPEITEDQARTNLLSWEYTISFTWKIIWNCKRIEVLLIENDQKESIKEWVKNSFEINKFEVRNLEKKPSQWDSYWTEENPTESYWEVKEVEGNLSILLGVELGEKADNLIARFHCEWAKKENLCHLPKMNSQGNLIINGFDKVVVFQSVRAPGVYFFTEEKDRFYGEIIPYKGSWINISYSPKHSRVIELKFPNSLRNFDLLSIFKTFSVPLELLEKIFSSETLNLEDYPTIEPLKPEEGLPQFLFTSQSSYFDIGKLGRKRLNQRLNLYSQLSEQLSKGTLYDHEGKPILEKNLLNLKKSSGLTIPHSTNELHCLKIKSPRYPKKTVFLVGYNQEISEQKNYFDLADLIGIAANYINLTHGLGKIDKEEEKDNLENQIVRGAGNLFYNIFNNRLGSFLQDLQNKYLAYISQLKKVNFLKLTSLENFDHRIKSFLNFSPLVQLQNQNNPLSEISYVRKLSVLGLGGFGSANATLNARNVNPSYYGRHDLVETPEGQKVGLIHNLTLGTKINEYEQIQAPYYKVEKGKVTPELVYLSNEEEKDKYMAHFGLEIDEKNQILEKNPLVRYQGDMVSIPREKIDYIDSSFYQLNSLTSATIPFFHHNDATRMLMATNMQRQAVTLLKSQAPLVASGIEKSLLDNSSLLVKAQADGEVEYQDSQQIIVKEKRGTKKVYHLKQLVVSNKNVLDFSVPWVKKGEKVKKEQILASGNYHQGGELSLGYNLRTAYLCWKGYNYEDAIVISERLVKEDLLTSFFAKKHTVIRYNTPHGPELFSAYFPRSNKPVSHLDKEGIVKVGSWVKGGEVLVGKLTPEVSPGGDKEAEELLFWELFKEKAQKFANSSLCLPKGEEGIVYEVRRKNDTGAKELKILERKKKQIEKKIEDDKVKMSGEKNTAAVKKQIKDAIQTAKNELKKIVDKEKKIKKLEEIEIYVAHQRKVEIGDKLTTRFGNKGVVAKIVPESDMPFDEEGKTIDIIFNPLSIPTRMNIGQLFETVLASAAHKLGTKLLVRPFNTPDLKTIQEILQEAQIKDWGNQKLFDGQTGLPFHQKVYQGMVYVIKLNHMVLDKLHFRGTGPYSMIYQQPLKGRAQEGGQRIGEMEGWVFEALGAAYTLMEMMGPKSDDIYKRRHLQNSFLFDNYQIDLRSSRSESFNLLLQYCWGIGFGLQAVNHKGQEINL
ncbi:MAG: hypothetical protein I3270_00620 [Candidatus Moeniiplasma glomeromycotorum]|nr:hypothetical protein [Candidatus Moeniiplasma glomeromycotorum]MCE8162203.1 hypothetical protein [Candidatus Moeniiplasma glomeromycotorum]MCE8166141.1 hypothetical protein [Candidatus Moeniiplasma glomeromycotorum]MCE8166602.1 hypothetical protein [Candidatus Moeniiplasma glomeromycotorum]